MKVRTSSLDRRLNPIMSMNVRYSVAFLVLAAVGFAAVDATPPQSKAPDSKEPPQATQPASSRPAASRQARPMKFSREYWPEAEGGGLKFEYEMRKDPVDGKWKRNGKSRALYQNGVVEREGLYCNDKRVGEWVFYNPDGTVTRRGKYPGDLPPEYQSEAATQPASQPATQPTTLPSDIGEEVELPGLPPGVKVRRIRGSDLPPGMRPPTPPNARPTQGEGSSPTQPTPPASSPASR